MVNYHPFGPAETRSYKILRSFVFSFSIIQASDVAHCMQHWAVYQKYNRRLFEEQYRAFINGDTQDDPRPGWYKGEIGFFSFYISKCSHQAIQATPPIRV